MRAGSARERRGLDDRAGAEHAHLVGTIHVAFGEAASGKVEPAAVGRRNARKEHVVDHPFKVGKSVAVEEATPLGSVAVRVQIQLEAPLRVQLTNQRAYRINARLLFQCGVVVAAVEVLPERVRAIVAAVDAIRVDLRDQLEYE